MAYTCAIAPPSLFLSGGRAPLKHSIEKIPVAIVTGRRRSFPLLVKAIRDQIDSSSQTSITKVIQNAWNDSEDRIALAGLGFASIAVLWASSNLITAIDKLPLVPSALEIIGILFSWWFVYRYLLFKPDREELVKKIKNSISDILGQ